MKSVFKSTVAVLILAGILGCDSGIDSSDPTINSVVGTWLATSSFTGFVLLNDGRFMYMEGDGDPPNGMEAGTYEFDSSAGTITFTVTFDGNSDGGIAPDSHGKAIPVTGTSSQLILTFTDSDGTVNMALNREPVGGTGIMSTWLNITTVDEPLSALVLSENNRFMYGEGAGVEPNGMEAGTYVYDSSAGTITFTVTFDNNSGGGIAPDWNGLGVSATLNNSILTLDGNFNLTRQ